MCKAQLSSRTRLHSASRLVLARCRASTNQIVCLRMCSDCTCPAKGYLFVSQASAGASGAEREAMEAAAAAVLERVFRKEDFRRMEVPQLCN